MTLAPAIDEKQATRDMVWATVGYKPTVAQTVFHADTRRLKLVAGGIRAGKSNSTAMEFVGECVAKNGLIWIVGPDYEQCKPEFGYLYDAFKRLGWVDKESVPEKGSRTMTLKNGCRIQTKSSDDTRSLASFAPNALLMVEAGQQTQEIYFRMVERALEHNAKVILSGTFEGAQSWYAEMFEAWQGPNVEDGRSFSIPSWSNSYIFPGGRDDLKIKTLEASMPAELFMERCGAVPYKSAGLVFRAFDQAAHIAELKFDPAWPIELAIDPAQHTYAVLAVQWLKKTLLEWYIHDELAKGTYLDRDAVPYPAHFTAADLKTEWTRVRVIDEVYEHDITAQEIIPRVMGRPWWRYIKPNAGVIDIAGTHRQANKSQTQIWLQEAKVSLRSKYIFIDESALVVNVRLQNKDPLGVPLLQFSHTLKQSKGMDGRANGVVAEMGLYKWPDWTEGQNNKRKPIDANNDGCKALGYWLYDKFGPVVERRTAKKKVVQRKYWGQN